VQGRSARRLLAKWFRIALGVLVAAGVLLALGHLGRRWNGTEVHLTWAPIILSLIVLVVANVFQGLGWLRLLERMTGKTINARPVLSVFMLAQLARYAPGKIGVPMVRISASARMGVPPQLVAASVGIDVGTWMGLGAIIGCITLLSSTGKNAAWLHVSHAILWLGLFVLLVGLTAALLVDRQKFPRFVLRMMRADGTGPFVSLQMVWMQLLSWVGWWLLGLLMPLAVGSSLAVAVSHASIFVIAPILGFLSLVAPGGLGVRETVISYALAPSLGASSALAAALLARGVAIASELLGWVLALSWERRK
jgi:glycosyltransferase 2 family protein